jgi:hypothetical protein
MANLDGLCVSMVFSRPAKVKSTWRLDLQEITVDNWLAVSYPFLKAHNKTSCHTSLCTLRTADESSVDTSDWSSGDRVDSGQLLCNVDEPAWERLCPAERTYLNPIQEWQACKMTTTSNTSNTDRALRLHATISYPWGVSYA